MASPKPTPPRETALAVMAEWPQEIQDPNEILGFGSLSGDMRRRLAAVETPFVITGATTRFWESKNEYSLILDLVLAPDTDHDTPWKANAMLGLPDDFNPETPSDLQGDREKIYWYFQHNAKFDALGEPISPRALGPCIFVMVATSQPDPYCAIRAATSAQVAASGLATR